MMAVSGERRMRRTMVSARMDPPATTDIGVEGRGARRCRIVCATISRLSEAYVIASPFSVLLLLSGARICIQLFMPLVMVPLSTRKRALDRWIAGSSVMLNISPPCTSLAALPNYQLGRAYLHLIVNQRSGHRSLQFSTFYVRSTQRGNDDQVQLRTPRPASAFPSNVR